MAINKVVFGNEVKMDLTNDSVSADNLLEGETAHDRSGSPVVGTAKQGHTIQNDSGTVLAQEPALQFVGVHSEDDPTNNKTKVNIIREMTKAQMDALSTDAKKGVIHTTDEPDNPPNPISADDVSYGDGTVEDALDSALNPAPSSMTNIDISAFTIASGNKYVFPSDGYVWTSVPNGTTPATIHIYAKDGTAFTYTMVSYPNIFVFPVYKGMMTAASNFSVFRFIQFSY